MQAEQELENFATRTFQDANILRITVATTGFCGGDTGHGGRTVITIEDLGSTDIDASFEDTDTGRRLEIRLGGDAELRTIILALRFAADALDSLTKE
jgi:hypothetical protein